MHRASSPFLFVLTAALLVGGCDCEDRIRKAISDPGRRTPGAADQAHLTEGAGPISGLPQGAEPREVEPNDTRATATRQELSRDVRPMAASLSAAKDQVDWFLVGAARDELVEINAIPQDPELDLELAIISSDDTPLIYDLQRGGGAEVVPYARIKAGEPLALRVRRKAGEGEYTLEHHRHMSAGEIETEPNDSWGDAVRLSGASTIQGFHDRPGDVDRFVLAASAKSYGVALSGTEEVEQLLRIYLGDTLAWEGRLEKGVPQVTLPNLATQREWRIEVAAIKEELFSRERSYTLQVLEHGALGAQEVLEVEPNDQPVTAGELSYDETLVNPLKVMGYLHDGQDTDVLRFPIEPREGMMRMRLTDRRPKRDGKAAKSVLTMRVGQPPGEAPLHAMPAGKDVLEHCELLTPEMLSTGEFDVSISQQSAQATGAGSTRALFEMMKGGEDYTLEVWREDVEGSGLSGQERASRSGASMEEAVLLDDWQEDGSVTQRGYLLRPGVAMWYAFDVGGAQGGADRLVSVGVERHELDLVLELMDDEGGLVASMQASGKGGEERGELRLPAGRYLVKVMAKEGTSCDAFTLTLKR